MTKTRSGMIAVPQATRRANIATKYDEKSDNGSRAAIADGDSTCTESATHTAINPVPSATEDPSPSDLVPTTNSTISAAFTGEANSVTEKDAPPMPSTQPMDTAANDFAPSTSAIVDTVANSPVPSATEDLAPSDPPMTKSLTSVVSTCNTNDPAQEDVLPMPSAQPANTTTNDSVPPPSASTVNSPPTATDNDSEINFGNTAGPQGSLSHPIDKAQTLTRKAENSQPVAKPKTAKRRSRRRASSNEKLICHPNSADDPIIVDDESSDDVPIARSINQVLRYRQHHIENIKASLDNITVLVSSTADSDQSGDYNSRRGEKRSFEDFLEAELDDSEQLKLFANNILEMVEQYRRKLQ